MIFFYSFSLSIVIFFSEFRNIEIIEENFTDKICFFIGLRTPKPTRTRTLNRIPIWHGLTKAKERPWFYVPQLI